MADIDLATVLADGEYLKREGDLLVGEIPATGTPGAVDAEGAVDATAAAFAAGTHTNVTVTYNDAAGSISLASTAAGGGLTDGDKGDITVGGSGTTLTIDANAVTTAKMLDKAVTYAKIQDLSANRVLGTDNTAGRVLEIPWTAQARLLISDPNAAAMRTTLGVPALYRPIVPYSATATTASLTDAGCYLRFTGTNPTYTVPPNSSVAFPVGTQIDGIGTATAMTLIQGAGVTITKARTLVTLGAGSGWTLIKTATDAWDLHGDLV